MGPTWGQVGAHFGPTWTNLGQLGPMWNQLQPAWASISHRRPTWCKFEAHTDLKIFEKQLFFLGFSDIFKKSLESFGKALGDALRRLWGRLGRLWGRLGKLWGCLGRPWGRLGGTPGRTLGFPWRNLLERPSRIHVRAKNLRRPLAQFSYSCTHPLFVPGPKDGFSIDRNTV